MKDKLHVTLLQSNIHWEDPTANCADLEALIAALHAPTDILVLCEMFTTGFSMSPERIAEPMHDQMTTLNWMRKWAKQLDACIAGSISVSENGQYYNRLIWMFPDGLYQTYDKRHTFTFAGEDKVYTRGDQKLIVEWKGWRIMPLICYDLRFPVWSKNRITSQRADYDVLLYVANWPAVRREPWSQLLIARAIENQTYLAAVNRVGTDPSGLDYSGDSVILDPRGQTLANALPHSNAILTAQLDASALHHFREKFPVLGDDDDEI
jgi:predicted amidohydrolase